MLTVCFYFLWLCFYSFVGWIYESILCSITSRKWVNRGFLYGPLCPIYGCGAVLILLTLSKLRNPLALFCTGLVLTGVLEYVTSWLLEKLFHARWWDYSKMRFQLNGRVCLAGALLFGLFAVSLILWIHPAVKSVTDRFPEHIVYLLSAVLFTVIVVDGTLTVVRMVSFTSKLHEIQAALNAFVEESKDRVRDLKGTLEEESGKRVRSLRKTLQEGFENSRFYSERIRGLLHRHNMQERRFLRAFPSLRSSHYGEALEKLKETVSQKLPSRNNGKH